MGDIRIVPFSPQYQAEARNLILSGLAEHWGKLDPARNHDLDDIGSSYSDGTFLVALLEGKVVGTGALLPRSNEVAEIMRMSVAGTLRRKGVGTLLLNRLCEHARSIGCRQVILETTQTWGEVISFYQQFGFVITHSQDGDVYFVKTL